MRDVLGGVKGKFSLVEYLMLWIGLVGSAVGLNLPKEMVSVRENASLTADAGDESRNPAVLPFSQEHT